MTQPETNSSKIGASGGIPRRRVSDFEHWRIVTFHQLGHYIRTNRFYGLFGSVVLISALTLAFEVDAGLTLCQWLGPVAPFANTSLPLEEAYLELIPTTPEES